MARNNGDAGRKGDAGHAQPSSVDALTAASFDDFFSMQHDSIVRALSMALGDDHFGRDAAAEGFARALQRWKKVSTFRNPQGWVYRVGLKWARSRRRKSRREVALGDSFDRGGVSPPEADTRVRPALARLSDDHRDVVVARYFLDWPEADIAEALDIRPGTVKSRLSRALAQLQNDLGSA